jgi:alanyl-tRNA synthetase
VFLGSELSKYFPVKTLEDMDMKRSKCSNCSCMFWSSVERDVCGDTSCVGTYSFIGDTPAKQPMEFAEVYLRFREFMKKRGYTHVERFPIVARWRDDLDFNIASIIGFQPYITKGIVAPPAEMVTIPQTCLRFPDVDNVGYTGRHGTNFVMIGQAVFKKPAEYDQAKYVKDLFEWFLLEMKIPKEEIQIHEDAWVGGGDCGPSMEFFSRGLELGNQVYMWYDMAGATDIKDIKELKLKVLDMGMGLERCCWFSKGSVNQYDASMPITCKYLFEKTGLKPDWKLYDKFLPHSGNLNLDEIDDVDLEWQKIADKIKVDVKELRNTIEPIAGIYSIADHSRTLLYALTDGALPSNVKGGYNLRIVLRRALDFIYKFN